MLHPLILVAALTNVLPAQAALLNERTGCAAGDFISPELEWDRN
jgi:hypothetical protein